MSGYSLIQLGSTAAALTPTTSKVTRDGQCVLEIHDNGALLSITKNYITLAAPQWKDTTPTLPTSYALKDACFNQFAAAGKAAAYALASDGANSAVFYNPDTLGAGVGAQGATQSGVYAQLRAGNAAGRLLIYGAGAITTILQEDFTVSHTLWTISGDWGTYYPSLVGITGGSWTARGFETVPYTNPYAADNSAGGIYTTSAIDQYIASVTLTAKSDYITIQGITVYPSYQDTSNVWHTLPTVTGPSDGTWVTITASINQTCRRVWLGILGDQNLAVVVKQVSLSSGAAATVRYSSDYGATFGAAVSAGASSGSVGGFDVARASGVSVAAILHGVARATTLGGAYTSLATFTTANPSCLVLPYYRIGSNVTSQTTSSTPDTLVGLDAPESGTCLFKLDGSGTKTAVTNPESGAVVPGPHCLTTLRGTKCAGIFKVGSAYKLYKTSNLAADGTCTWSLIASGLSSTATLRVRRNDPRVGATHGQCLVFDSNSAAGSGYSSSWMADGKIWPRVSPHGSVLAGDILG